MGPCIHGKPEGAWCETCSKNRGGGMTDKKDKPEILKRGSDHYKQGDIEPIEYILANKLGFCEGNVVKYITRFKITTDVRDLEKARHYIDFLIDDAYRPNGP